MRESKEDSTQRKMLLSILVPILKDLELARKRVEKLGTARWLFEFAYCDLESLSAGEITNFSFDSLALTISRDPKTMDNQDLSFAFLTALWYARLTKDLYMKGDVDEIKVEEMKAELKDVETRLAYLKDLETKIAQGVKVKIPAPAPTLKRHSAELELLKQPPPVDSWLYGFHNELRKNFEDFFSGHGWKHLEPATLKYLLCPGVRPSNDAFQPDSVDLDRNPHSYLLLRPVEHLMLVACRAVSAEREKFGVCERCQKPFIAEKNPLRKFCSNTCAQYVRTTRYRQKQRQA